MSQVIDKPTRDLINRMNKQDQDMLKMKASLNKLSNRSTSLVATGSFGAEPSNSHAALSGVLGNGQTHLSEDEKAQLSNLFSAGLLTGGEITDAGSETINVAAGTGMIRVADDQTALLITISWAQETGLAIPTNTSRHIGIEYNSGSPRVLITDTDSDFNEHDKFHLGDVVNEATVLHPQNIPHAVADALAHMIERMVQTQDPVRGFGLILAESGDANRRITVTAGSIWNRLTESAIGAIDTDPGGAADTFDIYYKDGGAGFTRVVNQTQWDMDSYDDDSGVLATLSSANKRGVIWFYMEFDGALVAQYGRAEHNTMAAAENEPAPDTAPDRISEHAMLIGRIIFQKNVTPAEQVDTVFTTFMTGTGVVDHDGLGGITTNDHHTKTSDADIIAAVEGEATLVLSGTITNPASNKGYATGTTGQFSMKHNGTNAFLFETSGSLFIGVIGANQDIFFDIKRNFQIRDLNDGSITLFKLDSSGRTLNIGAAAELVTTTMNGNLIFNNQSTGGDPIFGSNSSLQRLSLTGKLLVTDDVLLQADLTINANIGFYGTTPVVQSAAYTRNATIVEDRTLLASGSATAINNNNVLAALIADLQATGLLG